MIKSIPEHLILVDISDSIDDPKFEIYCETKILFDFRGKEYEVTIPAGFVTNFASVPKKFRNVISNVSKLNVAYLLHDWLYSTLSKEEFTKSDDDVMLRRNLKYLGLGYIDQWIVYFSVKFGAKKNYKTSV